MKLEFPETVQPNPRLELPMHVRWAQSNIENYTEDKFLYGRQWYRDQLASLPVELDGPVIDVGCGPGQWAIVIAEMYPKFEVVAFDCNEQLLDAARYQKATLGLANLHASTGDVGKIPYHDGYFKLTICLGVLQLVKVDDVFRELVRVTAPGGTIFINASGPGFYLTNILGALRSFKPAIIKQNWRFIDNTLRGRENLPFSYFTPARIRRMAEQHGLSVKYLKPTGLYPPQKSTCLGFGVNWHAVLEKP
jgi:ubiquinone/menaquinone biosynthesis C-methylase UbiE